MQFNVLKNLLENILNLFTLMFVLNLVNLSKVKVNLRQNAGWKNKLIKTFIWIIVFT